MHGIYGLSSLPDILSRLMEGSADDSTLPVKISYGFPMGHSTSPKLGQRFPRRRALLSMTLPCVFSA